MHVYYLYIVKSSKKNNEIWVHSTYFGQKHARVYSPGISPEQYPGKLEIMYCVLSTIVFEEINKCDLIYNTYRAVNTLES